MRGGARRGQHRAHQDAARRSHDRDTQVRHFRFGTIRRLPGRMVASPGAALLVAALNFTPPNASTRTSARLAAIDLAAVAAATDVEKLAALVAPSFSKAVLRMTVVVVDAQMLLTASRRGSLHGQTARFDRQFSTEPSCRSQAAVFVADWKQRLGLPLPARWCISKGELWPPARACVSSSTELAQKAIRAEKSLTRRDRSNSDAVGCAQPHDSNPRTGPAGQE